MKKLLLGALLLCLLPVAARADVDFKKPLDLKFTAIDGRKVDLSQLRGKVVLIDFWATWCPPCVLIAPDILNLYKKYHSQGLEIVGISADSDKSALIKYVKEEGAPWPQYFDDAGDQALFERLGVNSFPTLWLVNRQGIVVDPNFREKWAKGLGIPNTTSPETLAKVDAAIAKQLKAP